MSQWRCYIRCRRYHVYLGLPDGRVIRDCPGIFRLAPCPVRVYYPGFQNTGVLFITDVPHLWRSDGKMVENNVTVILWPSSYYKYICIATGRLPYIEKIDPEMISLYLETLCTLRIRNVTLNLWNRLLATSIKWSIARAFSPTAPYRDLSDAENVKKICYLYNVHLFSYLR